MSDRRRRKSLTIFRPLVAGLTPINEPTDNAAIKPLKKSRTASFFSYSPTTSESGAESATAPSTSSPLERINSNLRHKSSMDRILNRSRPRSLQKVGRPSSVFGSARSQYSVNDEQEEIPGQTISTPTSVHSISLAQELSQSEVFHHGEVQTASGMFRKKNQYLVLTDTHLVRLKNQARASELFPSIPSSVGKSSGM